MDTHQRIEAVRRRLREMQIDERAAELAGPPCVGCYHYGAVCGHIAFTERVFDPVTGTFLETSSVPPAVARERGGLCGPEAALFESFPLPHRAWERTKDVFTTIGMIGIAVGLIAAVLT